MKGGQIDHPPEKTTLKKPCLIRVKTQKIGHIEEIMNIWPYRRNNEYKFCTRQIFEGYYDMQYGSLT